MPLMLAPVIIPFVAGAVTATAVGYGIGVGVGHLYKYSRSQKLMANGEKPIEKGISMFDIVILLILSVLIFQLGMYMMS